MFDVAIQFFIEMIQVIPLFTCIVLIFNIINNLLFGGR